MQSRDASNVKIIDVSHHQGLINWPKVATDGVKGVFIKASQGTGYVDDMLIRNARGAAGEGIKVGYYHYCNPERGNAPEVEAEHFADTVQDLPLDLPLVLDVEGEAGALGTTKLTDWCRRFLKYLQKRTGKQVMVYTGGSFARSLGAALGEYPLWVAHYGVNTPISNGTWKEWSVFQYSSSGKVTGIAGNVDMNVMDVDFFRRFVPAAPPAVVIPTPVKENTVQPAGPDYTAKIVLNDELVTFGRIVDGRLEGKFSDLLLALGINYKWDNEQKKLYIYT
jgi:lysozyme